MIYDLIYFSKENLATVRLEMEMISCSFVGLVQHLQLHECLSLSECVWVVWSVLSCSVSAVKCGQLQQQQTVVNSSDKAFKNLQMFHHWRTSSCTRMLAEDWGSCELASANKLTVKRTQALPPPSPLPFPPPTAAAIARLSSSLWELGIFSPQWEYQRVETKYNHKGRIRRH